MEFWSRLMPEDEEIRGALYLAKVYSVRTKGELEELVRELCKRTGGSLVILQGREPLRSQCTKRHLPVHGRDSAIPKHWQRAVPGSCAVRKRGEMEYLAEEIRSFLVHKEWQGEVYKLLGDIRKKQGRTREAFENYFLALDHEPHPYIKNELSRIFLEDLYDGSRRTGFLQRRQT